MKNSYVTYLLAAIVVAANTTLTTFAQSSLSFDDFEQEVLDYSQQIKQSQSQREAMQRAMKLSKSAFYPAIDAAGNYQYRINNSDMNLAGSSIPLNHHTYGAEIGVLQPIYAGGSIRTSYEMSKIQVEISEKNIDLTTDNIIFAAESSYWGAAAQKAMYETMCEYVEIISRLNATLQDKYNDGMIAKTELIQMQSRLKEAELQRSNTHLSYQLALQNLNSLMGRDPLEEVVLSDSVMTTLATPSYFSLDEILDNRPDYLISQLDISHQQKQVSLSTASYRPSLAIGVKETWGTQMINVDSSTQFNSNVYLSLKIPVFRGGARRHQESMQTAILNTKRYQVQDMEDKISKEAAASWTELKETIARVEIARENCLLAEENLELNTFSYNEGKLQILDVLTAQINWIQAYTNLINSYYQQRVSHAAYQKSIGARYTTGGR